MPRSKAASSVKSRDEESDLGLTIILKDSLNLDDDGRYSINKTRDVKAVRSESLTQAKALTLEQTLGETTAPGLVLLSSSNTSGVSKKQKSRKSKSSDERLSTTSSITSSKARLKSSPVTSTLQAHSARRTPTDHSSLAQSPEESYPVPCCRDDDLQPKTAVALWMAKNDASIHPYFSDQQQRSVSEHAGCATLSQTAKQSSVESYPVPYDCSDDYLQHRSVSEPAGPVTRSQTARQRSVKASEFEAGPAGDQDVKALPGIGAVTAANLAADHGFTKAKQLVCYYVTVCKESKTDFKKFLRTVGANSRNQELCYQAVHKCAQEYM